MFILFTYVLNMTRFDVSIKKPVGLWKSSPRLARSGYRGIDVYYTQMNLVGVSDYTFPHNSTDILVKRFTPLDIKGCVSRMHCKNIMNIYLDDLNFFSKTSNEVYMG